MSALLLGCATTWPSNGRGREKEGGERKKKKVRERLKGPVLISLGQITWAKK